MKCLEEEAMTARYHGRKVEKDDFGNVIRRLDPCITISCKEYEIVIVEKMVSATGYSYDVFPDDDLSCVYVWVNDREDADWFMSEWKLAKRMFKKGA